MIEYVHAVPGRLRIRTALLRRNPSAAARARSRLDAVRGIRSVSVSPVTGSLIVIYDPACLTLDALWELLCREGLASAPMPRNGATVVGKGSEPLLEGFAQAASRIFLQTLAERSAAALLRALI